MNKIFIFTIATLLLLSCQNNETESVDQKKLQAFKKVRTDKRPNVIFVLTDDLDFDEVNFYNAVDFPTYYTDYKNNHSYRPSNLIQDPQFYMPTVDHLAKEGAVFNNFYTPSSVCTPSRYTFLTGKYPHQNPRFKGAEIENTELAWHVTVDKQEVNVAKYFNELGYNTAYFGKWHSGFKGFKNPYNAFNSSPLERRFSKDDYKRFVQHITDTLRFDHADRILHGNDGMPNLDWISEGLIEYIETPREGAFFMYISLPTPHGPYWSIEKTDPLVCTYGQLEKKPIVYRNKAKSERLNKEHHFGDQKALATWIDATLYNITTALKNIGEYDNTIIVFTSDHQSRGKFMPYEGSRIPFFIWYPEKIKPQVSNQLSSSIDLWPTVIDYLDTSFRATEDAVSLKPFLDGQKEMSDRSIFLEIKYSYAVIQNDWKYIKILDKGNSDAHYNESEKVFPYLRDEEQLYNLKEDITEQVNLLNHQEYLSIQADLKSQLDSFITNAQNYMLRP